MVAKDCVKNLQSNYHSATSSTFDFVKERYTDEFFGFVRERYINESFGFKRERYIYKYFLLLENAILMNPFAH